MLRITERRRAGDEPVLVLEGRLVSDWNAVLEGACAAHRHPPGEPLRVDLSGVAFADAAGVDLLHRLLDDGIMLIGCPPYLAAMLGRSPPAAKEEETPE